MTTAPPRTSSASRAGRGHSGLLFVAPALVLVVAVTYLGVGYNAGVSLLDWNGVSPDPEFVGLGNYARILQDQIFLDSLWHVALFGVVTILVQMVVGLAMALVLSGPVFGRSVYKVLMFLPVVLAPAAIATAFRQIYSPAGPFNEFLRAIGLDVITQAWIADPRFALLALAATNIWAWTGFSFILYQAAISQLDGNLVEAAQLDGAGPLRTVWSVIVPQLRGTHITLALIGAIGSLKTFDLVWLITGGGPGRATEFLTTYIYKEAILQFHTGYAAALSIVLLLIAVVLTLAQMRVYRFGRS